MSAAPQPQNPFEGFFQNVGNLASGAMKGAQNVVQQVQQNPLTHIAEAGFGVPGASQQAANDIKNEIQQIPQNLSKADKQMQLVAQGKAAPPMYFGAETDFNNMPGMSPAQAIGNGASEYPYSKSPNFVQKAMTGQDQNTRQIRFQGNQNAPALKQNANDTLDRLGVKGSANDQLAQFPQMKNNIYNWIKNASSMAQQDIQIPIQEIKDSITKQVQKEFGSKLSSQEMDKVVTDHMNNVYDRAQQDVKQPPAQGQAINPYFNSTSDMSPTTIKGQSATGNYTAPPADFIPGKTIPQIKNAAVNNPSTEATLNFNQPAPESAQPKFAYNNQSMSSIPNQPQATGYGDITPNTIGSRSIYNMKVAANNTPEVSNAFDKIMNGQRAQLTDEEKAAIAGRTGLDNIITKYHPDVKQATTDLSVLNNPNVYKSLEKASYNIPAKPDLYGKVIPPGLQNYLPGSPILKPIVNNILATRKGLTTAGAVMGGAGLVGAGYMLGKGKPQTNAASTIPQSTTTSSPTQTQNPINSYLDVKPTDNQGHFALDTQTNPDPNYPMTRDQYLQARSLISPYDPGAQIKLQDLDTAYNTYKSNATNALSGDKMTFMKFAKDSIGVGNKITDELNDPNFLTFLNSFKTIDQAKQYLSTHQSPYSGEVANLDAMNTFYTGALRAITGERLNPGDAQLLHPNMSKEQLTEKLTKMQQFVKGSYQDNLAPYLVLTSGTNTNNTNGNPQPIPTTGLSTQKAVQPAANTAQWATHYPGM